MTLPPTLISVPDDDDSSRAQLSLLVIADEGVARYPLPPEGIITIGRANECDIRVDDPSISREHAHLYVGAALKLVDLGSANGSRVSGAQIAANTPVEVEVGEVFELGSSLIVAQRVARELVVAHIAHMMREGHQSRPGETGGRVDLPDRTGGNG